MFSFKTMYFLNYTCLAKYVCEFYFLMDDVLLVCHYWRDKVLPGVMWKRGHSCIKGGQSDLQNV